MKRTVLKFSVGMICLAGIYGYNQTEKEHLTDLALENIEALAGNENTNFACAGEGDIDCYGMKVKYRVDGLR